MEYGKHITTTQIDDNGSTLEKETSYSNSDPIDVKERYEIRVRVYNAQDEMTEFLKFRDETKDMAKAEFRIEHTDKANKNGAYYIVKCWTIRNIY